MVLYSYIVLTPEKADAVYSTIQPEMFLQKREQNNYLCILPRCYSCKSTDCIQKYNACRQWRTDGGRVGGETQSEYFTF